MTTEGVYIKYKHYICKMEKEFIPYELALRMKQLGFDEPCFNLYHLNRRELMYVCPNIGEEIGRASCRERVLHTV
jgi:predicted RNA-binding Zn-ribbon protein involved in translation (DUF1610 family)